MRSNDMKVGGAYRLEGRGYRKVTVLETPAEVRSKARVRVRFENGVKAGTIADLPSRRIARPWGEGLDERPAQPEAQGWGPPVEPVERAVRTGDTVTLLQDETGLLWTVEAIRERVASLRTEIFGRPSTRQVAIDQLQVYERPQRPRAVLAVDGQAEETSASDDALDEKRWVSLHLSPQQPKRALDRILDQLVFSQACLRMYGRRFAPGLKGQAVVESLREEIRRKGFLMRGEEVRGSGYARLRVQGRFDIVLHAEPEPEEAVMVNWIHFPVKRKKSAKPRRRAA
ncbi:MAG TPA: hypothetical protein VG816_12270 [Solirubrobacterales bacterium]|nr:hypothetical protein [Solirubrobacterales bacterium]